MVATSDRGEKITRPLTTTDIEFSEYRFDDPRKVLNLFKTVRTADPDVILVDSVSLAGAAVMLAGFCFSIPHVVRLRGDSLQEIRGLAQAEFDERNMWATLVQGLRYVGTVSALLTSSHFIPISDYLGRKYKRYTPASTVVHTPCFMLEDKEQTANPSSLVPDCRKNVVLSVMNMHFSEKVSGLLDSLEQISEVLESRGDTTMLIAGDGVHRETVEQRCDELAGDIRTLGYVSDIKPLYERADVFAHFSYLDAYPSTVLEAYATQTPVIANDAVGMSEQVNHGETGFLVALDKNNDVSRRLNYLLESPEERAEMGKSGYKRVTANNSMESVGSRLRTVLTNVMRTD